MATAPRKPPRRIAHGTRIGISGWRYAPWRGVFYPEDLAQRRELEFASRRFDTIEINGSFYSLQLPESWRRWRDETPGGFVFAVKAPRYITHLKRLHDIDAPLANFFASGVLELHDKLGPILWQFPPNLRFDEALWDDFLAALPRDTRSARALARRHDHRVRGVSLPRVAARRLRHAVEIRHDSFRDERFIALLRRHDIALVVADTAGKWPLLEDVTADFMYLRLHGDKEIYASGYTPKALDAWAKRIDAWRRGREPEDARRVSARSPRRRARRDVYCYFDNDMKVRAPFDAEALRKRLADG
ncbi:MAG TPA: DUF72 domain-containing protein [Rhodanobacteraceae bacterium]|nr:DUF72 domain-containing protein [Rhodanobacteraceae bacterium]